MPRRRRRTEFVSELKGKPGRTFERTINRTRRRMNNYSRERNKNKRKKNKSSKRKTPMERRHEDIKYLGKLTDTERTSEKLDFEKTQMDIDSKIREKEKKLKALEENVDGNAGDIAESKLELSEIRNTIRELLDKQENISQMRKSDKLKVKQEQKRSSLKFDELMASAIQQLKDRDHGTQKKITEFLAKIQSIMDQVTRLEKRDRDEEAEANRLKIERQEEERRIVLEQEQRDIAKRLEEERLEEERLAAEAERLKAEAEAENARKLEEERKRQILEAEENERKKLEEAEVARAAAEAKAGREKHEAEMAEKALIEAREREKERLDAEEQIQIAKEKAERERQEAEAAEAVRVAAREEADAVRMEAEARERERQEAEERVAAEKRKKQRLAAEERERIEAEQAEAAREAREAATRAEEAEAERERQEARERERQRLEAERQARQAEEERLAAEEEVYQVASPTLYIQEESLMGRHDLETAVAKIKKETSEFLNKNYHTARLEKWVQGYMFAFENMNGTKLAYQRSPGSTRPFFISKGEFDEFESGYDFLQYIRRLARYEGEEESLMGEERRCVVVDGERRSGDYSYCPLNPVVRPSSKKIDHNADFKPGHGVVIPSESSQETLIDNGIFDEYEGNNLDYIESIESYYDGSSSMSIDKFFYKKVNRETESRHDQQDNDRYWNGFKDYVEGKGTVSFLEFLETFYCSGIYGQQIFEIYKNDSKRKYRGHRKIALDVLKNIMENRVSDDPKKGSLAFDRGQLLRPYGIIEEKDILLKLRSNECWFEQAENCGELRNKPEPGNHPQKFPLFDFNVNIIRPNRRRKMDGSMLRDARHSLLMQQKEDEGRRDQGGPHPSHRRVSAKRETIRQRARREKGIGLPSENEDDRRGSRKSRRNRRGGGKKNKLTKRKSKIVNTRNKKRKKNKRQKTKKQKSLRKSSKKKKNK